MSAPPTGPGPADTPETAPPGGQSPADQFSDEEMGQIKHYGEAMGGKPTPFDEEVERRIAVHEKNYAKMQAAATAGSTGLGPSDIEQSMAKQQAAVQQQTAAQGAQKAQQAQSAQSPPNAPPAPSGPLGVSQPYPAQRGEPAGGTEQPPQGTQETPPPGAGSGGPPGTPGP